MAPSLSSAGELLLPQDLDWTLVFVSFLNRYPSDTDNQIYSSSETRIWNHTLLVLILCTASFQILSLNFIMCSSMLCPLSFDSTLENFEFRWSIAGLILKALSLLLCFLLSAKCRIWRISQKRCRIIVFWIPSLQIRLSSLQYSIKITIKKFIPKNAFIFSLVTVKLLPFW